MWGSLASVLDEEIRRGPSHLVNAFLNHVAFMKAFWAKSVVDDAKVVRHVFWQRGGRDIWEGVDVTEVRDATTIGPGAEAHLMWLLDVPSCSSLALRVLRAVLLLLMRGATDESLGRC